MTGSAAIATCGDKPLSDREILNPSCSFQSTVMEAPT
jgi:hypothetical protein